MKNHTNISKINRAKAGACSALGAVISATVLAHAVSFSASLVTTVILGLCLGVLAWVGYEQSGPLRDTSHPTQWGLVYWATSKGYVMSVVVSAFVVSFGWLPSIKLMGVAALVGCIGFVTADTLANRK
jgi:hypothetical protein